MQPPDRQPTPSSRSLRLPLWRLPPGVAPGTWEYTQRESIANEYSAFLRNTPLIGIDVDLTLASLPNALPNRATRVIDFGCGDGRALHALWERGYDVLGVDMSQSMLGRVVQSPHGAAMSQRLLRANLVQLGCLTDGCAAHAVCLFSTIGMISGRRNRREFMRHASRIVRSGGTFVLHVHNRNDAWKNRPAAVAYARSAWNAFRSRDCELGDRTYSYRGLADMFLHTYSLRELRADLVATGWKLERVLPLSSTSDSLLPIPKAFPGLRAGGFIAVATSRRDIKT